MYCIILKLQADEPSCKEEWSISTNNNRTDSKHNYPWGEYCFRVVIIINDAPLNLSLSFCFCPCLPHTWQWWSHWLSGFCTLLSGAICHLIFRDLLSSWRHAGTESGHSQGFWRPCSFVSPNWRQDNNFCVVIRATGRSNLLQMLRQRWIMYLIGCQLINILTDTLINMIITRSIVDGLATDMLLSYQLRVDRQPTDINRPLTVNQWKSTDTLPIFHRLLINFLSLADWYIGCHSIEHWHISIDHMSVINWSTPDWSATDMPLSCWPIVKRESTASLPIWTIDHQSIITVEKFGDTDVGNVLVDCH